MEEGAEASLGDAEQKEPLEDELSAQELKTQLEEVRALAAERLDLLLRCRADLENTLKRVERDREENYKYASEKLMSKLLFFLDSLEQASKHDEGARMLYQQLMAILQGEGLESIDAMGKKFDPFKHEALMQVKTEDFEEDYVAQEIQRGYTLNSKVIRFSKVAVAKR